MASACCQLAVTALALSDLQRLAPAGQTRNQAGWAEPLSPVLLDEAGVRRHFILRSVHALGIARARWIADYYRLRPRVTDAELAPLVADILQQETGVDPQTEAFLALAGQYATLPA